MRPAVRDELIEILRQPHTYEDVASILGVSYHTARRWVQELMGDNLVREMVQRSADGKLMYQLNTETASNETIRIPFQGEMRKLHEMAGAFKSRGEDYLLNSQTIGMMLSRSRWRGINLGKGEGDPSRVREGYLFPVEMRSELRERHRIMKDLCNALEHMILRDELWEDDGKLWDRSGADDVLDRIELLADAERDRQSQKIKEKGR